MSTTETGPRWDRLLVSICNSAADPKPSCLLLLDPYTATMRLVPVGPDEDLVVSGVGLCSDDARIFHLSITTGFRTRLSVLDRATLSLIHHQELPAVHDPHSICRIDDGVAIASTGSDEILFYELADGLIDSEPKVLWAASDKRADTHHVNALSVHEGTLFCTAFGPRAPGTWATANDGYVLDVSTGKKILTGLQHPHSLVMRGDVPTLCNSREGSVLCGDEAIAYAGGYSRGLAFGSTGTMYFGSSFARTSGRDRGAFENPADRGRLRGRCTVSALPESGTRTEWDLSHRGFEIYDILALEEAQQK